MADDPFKQWQAQEAVAESMIPLIGTLYREHDILLSVYGHPLINRSVMAILQAHQSVGDMLGSALTVKDTYPVLQQLAVLKVKAASIDVGKLAVGYQQHQKTTAGIDLKQYMVEQLAPVLQRQDSLRPRQDVVLYGFGRIGRLLARLLIEEAGTAGPNLRAIVVRKGVANDLQKRSDLLLRDSVHGAFRGTVTVDEANRVIYANGVKIQVIAAQAPAEVDYAQYGIQQAIVVDNTGQWRDQQGLVQHLQSPGAARVLLTAPGKGTVKNIVYGVNQGLITAQDRILSAASCTTNAITPVLQAIHGRYGIDNGHIETVHAYTNDQNLLDNYHRKARRGRSAALNMVITETGAAQAVGKALPALKGKLTGSAIRVPTPNVSLAVLTLNLQQATSVEVLNGYLRDMAFYSDLHEQIDFVDSPDVVSSDFVGSCSAGVVDGQATLVADHRCVVYVWYDNEFGYSCQVNRLLQLMAGAMGATVP